MVANTKTEFLGIMTNSVTMILLLSSEGGIDNHRFHLRIFRRKNPQLTETWGIFLRILVNSPSTNKLQIDSNGSKKKI